MFTRYSITLDGKEVAKTEAFNDAADILDEMVDRIKESGGRIMGWMYDNFMLTGVDYEDEDITYHKLRCEEVIGP